MPIMCNLNFTVSVVNKIRHFFLFMGFFNGFPQGIVYLVCVLINHLFGLGFKTFFAKYPRFLKTPIKKNYPMNPVQTINLYLRIDFKSSLKFYVFIFLNFFRD